jgi:quercetin 2,3-dioxygenase
MKKILHRAETRGHANHGWLDSHHSFSFAGYYDPERMGFGKLRVINDDIVAGGRGFGKHPHQNMEIISIPLSGDLAHRDSMGHIKVIQQGDVQIMSAGTGVTHSEFNHNADQSVNFLQIWVLPKEQNIEPRYAQETFLAETRKNSFQTVVSPQAGQGVWINQDAYFSLGNLENGFKTSYQLHNPSHGVYVFVIEGQAQIAGEKLAKRDGMGVWQLDSLEIEALADTEILLIEVPME